MTDATYYYSSEWYTWFYPSIHTEGIQWGLKKHYIVSNITEIEKLQDDTPDLSEIYHGFSALYAHDMTQNKAIYPTAPLSQLGLVTPCLFRHHSLARRDWFLLVFVTRASIGQLRQALVVEQTWSN